MYAAAVAAGASLRDAYMGSGYEGDPANGHGRALVSQPDIAERIAELTSVRSAKLMLAAPTPVGLPSADTWLAEMAAGARQALAAGAYSAAMQGYDKVLTRMGAVTQGLDSTGVTTEKAVATTMLALAPDSAMPDYSRALAAALAAAPQIWQQLQVSVQSCIDNK